MDTEENLQCRREQYRLRRDRETSEEAERRRHRNREYVETKSIYEVEELHDGGAGETHKN